MHRIELDQSADAKIRQELYELCFDAVHTEDMINDHLLSKLTKLQELSHEFPSVLLDVMQSIDATVENDDADKSRLRTLIDSCVKKFLTEDLIKSSVDCLSDDSVNKQLIRMKTRLFYKQLKFNLLREESEGFSKLICELCYEENETEAETALERIRCIIGQFNLDPNRVLDLMLECFEYNPHRKEFFLDLLRLLNSSKSDVGHLLGFKFTSYQKKYMGRAAPVPDSLYILTATLIINNLLDIMHICSYLCPNLDAMLIQLRTLLEPSQMRSKQCITNTKLAQEDIPLEVGLAPGPIQSNSEVPLIPAEEMDIGINQKLGLLWGLVKTNNWKDAQMLLDRLPEYYATRSARVAEALIDLVEISVVPLYHSKCVGCGLEAPSQEYKSYLVTDWQSFADYSLSILRYLGPSLALRPVTLTRITRLFASFIKEYTASKAVGEDKPGWDKLYNLFVDVCDDVLIPSMTALQPGNVAFSEELWAYISQLSYTVRYRFYGRWKLVHTPKHPILTLRKGQMMGRARYVMKRLSKDTTKLTGRQLGKMTHCHPTFVFDHILNQLQTFENFIVPVVDSMKVISSMEFDVLSYCIIDHLSDPLKQKLKVSDAMLSPWLQSLSTFVGLVFRKNSMELTGVLQYVANQLKMGTSLDLLVLREIIVNMSGIETTSQLTQDQLEALAGGDLLRQEGGYLGTVRNVKRTSSRLKEALQQEDLTVGLCILVAQQRACIIYKEGQEMIHLKLLGQVYDQCQDTLVQFGSFLFSNVKMDEYSKRMPRAPELMATFHVSCDAAFFLTRPIYTHLINSKFEYKKKKEKNKENKEGKEGKDTPVLSRMDAGRKVQLYLEACNEVMEPLTDALKPLYPSQLWSDLNPRLLATFWSLNMYDLHVPQASYARETDKIRKAISDVEVNKDLSESKRRKEKDRLESLQRKLEEEERRQKEHVARVVTRLEAEKETWFPHDETRKQTQAQITTLFIQHCIRTRCSFSDLDALFCAKFIFLLHTEKVSGFSMITFLDKLFNDLMPWIAGLSENETHFFGRFCHLILDRLTKWYTDKMLFNKECLNTPSFSMKLRDKSNKKTNIFAYDSYETLFRKWHFKITRVAFASAGIPNNYVVVRNTFILMMKILPNFPLFTKFTDMLDGLIADVSKTEKDKRPDLHLLVSSYWGNLRMRKDKVKMLEYEEAKPSQVQVKRVISTKATSNKVSTASKSSPAPSIKPVTALKSSSTSRAPTPTSKPATKSSANAKPEVSDPKPTAAVKPAPAPKQVERKDEPAAKTKHLTIKREVVSSVKPSETSSKVAGEAPARKVESSDGAAIKKEPKPEENDLVPPTKKSRVVSASQAEPATQRVVSTNPAGSATHSEQVNVNRKRNVMDSNGVKEEPPLKKSLSSSTIKSHAQDNATNGEAGAKKRRGEKKTSTSPSDAKKVIEQIDNTRKVVSSTTRMLEHTLNEDNKNNHGKDHGHSKEKDAGPSRSSSKDNGEQKSKHQRITVDDPPTPRPKKEKSERSKRSTSRRSETPVDRAKRKSKEDRSSKSRKKSSMD